MNAVPSPLLLIVNSGSSSLKFALFQNDEAVLNGKVDGIRLHVEGPPGTVLFDQPMDFKDRDEAIAHLIDWLRTNGHLDGIAGIGYRIVHGGPDYSDPALINPEVMAELRRIVALAPDHLPDQIAAIEKIGKDLPGIPAVACFDTAFHRTMPRYAQMFGLPRTLIEEGVVRYGFHGLSYSYIVEELRREGHLPERLIVAHLGNGASMAAIRNGESIDTSMGLTPSGGFLMSNRSGDLDPGVILWMLREKKMSVEDIADAVNQNGGLKGLSGSSGDMQQLETEDRKAVYVFCYQVKKYLGAYMAALGGLDMLVFTGGIGENSALVREWVCSDLERLGIELRAGVSVGKVEVRVMKTNEELMIARSTANLLKAPVE